MARKPPKVNVIDFETKGIERRPEYPPKPTSVSIQRIGERKPTFYCWDHPEGNNCVEDLPKQIMKDIARSGENMLFHNAKFDLDVAQEHWKIGPVSWDRVHDSMFLLFLDDPHQKELSLKPASERLLDMPPEERDDVKDWILAHKKEIEAEHGKFTPKEWGKHISLVPGQVVGPYANGDVTRTLKLFNLLHPAIMEAGMGRAYDREREVMPILLENERKGIRVDVVSLERDIKVYEVALKAADNWLRKRIGNKDLDFEKDREVAAALKLSGIVTDFVQTATGQDSVSKKNLTPDMFNDVRVAQVLGYRNRLVTCLTTFMRPWLRMAGMNGGWMSTNWNQVRNTEKGGMSGARTGRLSSSSPNFMNMPKAWEGKGDGYEHPRFLRSLPELPLLRKYILPDSDKSSWLHRDYNQQELRILGHFEDGALMDAYNDDPRLDVHQFVRDQIMRIFHIDVPRSKTKTLNFGMLYGMGLGALAEQMHTTIDEAKKLKKAQLSTMPGLKELNDGIIEGANNDQPIRTWGGRLYYKEPTIRLDTGRRIDFGYKLLNYLIQGSAADCTKQALINYDAIKRNGRFTVTVHDEMNISAPDRAIKSEMKLMREAMAAVEFSVPMLSDAKVGKTWGAITKYEDPR